jgi:membrane fusion protein, macrolide-specific efflux system
MSAVAGHLGMRTRRTRWIIVISAAAVSVFVLRLVIQPRGTPPKFVTAAVVISDIEATVLAIGTIQPSKMVNVGAQASGRIIALHAVLGDHVEKGQLLAEIDPSAQQNILLNAQAVRAQYRAQRAARAAILNQTSLTYQRAQATWERRLTSRADFDAAEAAYESAKAEVTALDAQIHAASIAVDLARVTLGYTKVTAPISGTVVAIVTPEGQTVNALQTAPTIVKLADLETMTVKAQISEADVTHVHARQQLYFTILADPDRRYYAALKFVEPAPESLSVDNGTVNTPAQSASNSTANGAIYYNGIFDIANPGHELQPSMTAEVHIVLGRAKDTLSIPYAALGEADSSGRRLVRVVNASRAVESRWIKIGLNNSSIVQVTDGLRLGDTVIVGSGDSHGSDAEHSQPGTT